MIPPSKTKSRVSRSPQRIPNPIPPALTCDGLVPYLLGMPKGAPDRTRGLDH
jgi:hypothetical protein